MDGFDKGPGDAMMLDMYGRPVLPMHAGVVHVRWGIVGAVDFALPFFGWNRHGCALGVMLLIGKGICWLCCVFGLAKGP